MSFFWHIFFENLLQLYNFFGFLMDHFTPASSESKTTFHVSLFKSQNVVILVCAKEKKVCSAAIFLSSFNKGNLISHIFRKNEICGDADWERYFCYDSVEVPASYGGPHLTFPMTSCGVSKLVEAFKHKQVSAHTHTHKQGQSMTAKSVHFFCLSLGSDVCTVFFFWFLPSSSSMLGTFCSSSEKPGDFWESCPTSIKSRPATPRRSPYVVRCALVELLRKWSFFLISSYFLTYDCNNTRMRFIKINKVWYDDV